MNRTDTQLLDLPNELLLTILKKLDNMDVLYSLIGIDVERLNCLAQDKTFTNTLNFLSTDTDDICSINDSILNRFYRDILPRIQCNVRCLIFESMIMQRVLLATNYPNLTQLKIFNFNQDIVSRYFTNESPFQTVFKQQITDLTLISNDKDQGDTIDFNYTASVYARIFNFFENLQHLSVVSPSLEYGPPLCLRGLPSTTFFSSTLTKLSISVYYFDDCLSLLDSRLKQLSTFVVNITSMDRYLPLVYNSDDLPNLKCFSLTSDFISYGYDTQIVPLLRRMCNLEELTLHLCIENRSRFVDGNQLHDEILIHMPRLHTFIFYVNTRIEVDPSSPRLSSNDIQRTFTNIGYDQVDCIMDYFRTHHNVCHVFSLPFAFDRIEMLGNNFPNIIFNNVTLLWARDTVRFKHEFFVRIARSFPLLKSLILNNLSPQIPYSGELESDNNESYSVVEYPRITSLDITHVHIDYVEQFLHEAKTHLPQLTELKIRYDKLQTVTENFTRDSTRNNCMKVKRLIIPETMVHTEDVYAYFPFLSL